MKIAVIDVGFNSLKMVQYRIEPGGTPKFYGQIGIMARLGEGLESTGYLGSEPISRTIDAIRVCKETALLESIDHLILIGTSPVREAANREEFLKLVQAETGLRMRVLTGNEEALYGLLGALRSIDAPRVLFFDLGGGSLELAYADRRRIRRILSLPLGALKLTDIYSGKGGDFSKKERARMAKHVASLLPSRKELDLDKDAILVGTGGTVRAIARYDQDEVDYPLDKVHNYAVGLKSVQTMGRKFFKMKPEDLDKVDAIGEERSETITAGTLVVKSVMRRLGFNNLLVSTHGLRDGILSEFLEGGVRSPDGVASKDEVERLLNRPSTPPGMADFSSLLECMNKHELIDGRQSAILLAGTSRGHSPDTADADPDAAFGILMSEDMAMSHLDQLLVALSVVRSRRPRTANWLARRYSDMLSSDARQVKKLGACLRLMDVLARSKAQFRVAYSGGLRISIVGNEVPFPLELARTAALGLSASIKQPVTIFVSAKDRARHAGLVSVRGQTA